MKSSEMEHLNLPCLPIYLSLYNNLRTSEYIYMKFEVEKCY
jgi:hypothetical protein